MQQYAVTYYKPETDHQNVQWTDNAGNTGTVDVNVYHRQASYYPLWVTDNSYTLYGTNIGLRNEQDPTTGFWYNREYEWGYADNFGNDLGLHIKAFNSFKIENAINHDGTTVTLKYIDFVKVQTGVNGKSGWLGEISTEIFGINEI
jgi:hypothetical protein